MKIEKIMQAYFREKLEAQQISSKVPSSLLAKAGPAASGKKSDNWVPQIFFFGAVVSLLVFLILGTPEVSSSLQRLDPDHVKIQTLNRDIQKSLDFFWARFYPKNPQQRRLP